MDEDNKTIKLNLKWKLEKKQAHLCREIVDLELHACRTTIENLEGNEEGLALNLDLFDEKREQSSIRPLVAYISTASC